MILNPNSSVSELKKQWQGLEKAFENLDTNWEGFQQRHDLSDETIDDLKTLSQDGGVYLDKLTIQSVTEMMEVSELRSTIMVSI
jgi:prefoldin subunit 5